eukprot:156689-Prorocentrum_lima.AAC.1
MVRSSSLITQRSVPTWVTRLPEWAATATDCYQRQVTRWSTAQSEIHLPPVTKVGLMKEAFHLVATAL